MADPTSPDRTHKLTLAAATQCVMAEALTTSIGRRVVVRLPERLGVLPDESELVFYYLGDLLQNLRTDMPLSLSKKDEIERRSPSAGR